MKIILCPLQKEWKLLAKALEKGGLEKRIKDHQGLDYIHFPEPDWFLCPGGHGKTQFALMTQFWCYYLGTTGPETTESILSVGAAGALEDSLNPGDLLLVDEIIEHDYKSSFGKKDSFPLFSPQSLSLNTPEGQKANSLDRQNPKGLASFHIHQGRIASGDEDILSPERRDELRVQTGAKAVAWESAGGIRAAQLLQRDYFEIRGITDRAQGHVHQNFHENLERAMGHCAQVLLNQESL